MKPGMVTLNFAQSHPSGAGHFPGNPIIPGALLLAEVVSEIASASGRELEAAAVRSAKFFHPVRPGDSVEIEYAITAHHEMRFQCVVAGVKVLTGVVDAASGA